METEQEMEVEGFADKKHELPFPAYVMQIKLITNVLIQYQYGNGNENREGNKNQKWVS